MTFRAAGVLLCQERYLPIWTQPDTLICSLQPHQVQRQGVSHIGCFRVLTLSFDMRKPECGVLPLQTLFVKKSKRYQDETFRNNIKIKYIETDSTNFQIGTENILFLKKKASFTEKSGVVWFLTQLSDEGVHAWIMSFTGDLRKIQFME